MLFHLHLALEEFEKAFERDEIIEYIREHVVEVLIKILKN
jgi:hypothetical protein